MAEHPESNLGFTMSAKPTITNGRKLRQVGDITDTAGKAFLNSPESVNKIRPVKPKAQVQNASWQIPRGVTKANWEYAQASHISTGYDEFLEGDPLTAADRQIIARYLPEVTVGSRQSRNQQCPIVADFGCGNGRTLGPLLQRGYRGIGIDLSIPMLTAFKKKESDNLLAAVGSPENLRLLLVQANLVELDCVGDDSVDHGISLFSTLGMIQGARHRAAFLAHVRRMIKPGGKFILHAHNVWFQIRHPGGFRWAIKGAFDHLRGTSEFGDRTANYRSIRQVFIHSFRRRELATALREAGFNELKWFGILPGDVSPTEGPLLGSSIRLVGWIVVCQ